MANFSNLIITTKGHELNADFLAGEISTNIQTPFTRIVTSAAIYTPGELESLTTLDEIHQETLVSNVSKQNKTTIEIHGSMENSTLTVGYRLNTVGVYFRDPADGQEYLFGVAIHIPTPEAPAADFIFPFNGLTTTGLIFDLLANVGNADNVSLNVNPAATVTVKMLNNHNQDQQAHEAIRNTPNGIAGFDSNMNLGSPATPINTLNTTGITQGSTQTRFLGTQQWTTNIANEKFDIIIPRAPFGGFIEVEIASSLWGHTNSRGGITKRFAVSHIMPAGTLTQDTNFTAADAPISNFFTISDIYPKNNQLAITIAKLGIASDSNVSVSFKVVNHRNVGLLPVDQIFLSGIYTDDPTVYPPAALHPPPQWFDLVFQNGFQAHPITPLQVSRNGNGARLSGIYRNIVSSSIALNTLIATIPGGLRPQKLICIYTAGVGLLHDTAPSPYAIEIHPSGRIYFIHGFPGQPVNVNTWQAINIEYSIGG